MKGGSMLNSRKRRRLSLLLFAVMFFSLLFSFLTEPVFARDGPDVELYVYGEKSSGGPMFDTAGDIADGLWAPGVRNSGTMRIYNNYSDRISIYNIGIRLKLYDTINEKEVTDENLIKEFAEAMKLTIKSGSLPIFKKVVYDNSFHEMLYDRESPDRKGFELAAPDRITISKNASIDLEYTVRMDESAGNSLQGLRASVDFVVRLQENPYDNPHDDDKEDHNDDDDGDRDDGDDGRGRRKESGTAASDIDGHWAHDCIIALIEHDVLEPDSNGSVRPDDYITRAEAAVLMGKALRLEESKDLSTGYVDAVPTWARGYIIATTKAKVFKGYPGRIFKAFGYITREEMTAVLMRAFRNDKTSNMELKFKDSDMIAGWSRGNVAAAVEEGIITGYPEDNTFRPRGYMKRAEAFTIVCKLLGYHGEHNKKLSSVVNLEGGELIE